jgi:mannose-6-phosphate isomerase-like protein (cupin superfamily)
MDDLSRIRQLANIKEEAQRETFVIDIEKASLENDYYRNVIYTGPHLQLVLMSLQPGEEIGEEVHTKGDQFIRVEAGTAEFVLNGDRKSSGDNSAVVIPQGMRHNVINVGDDELKLYVVYSHPEHPDGTQEETKPAN